MKAQCDIKKMACMGLVCFLLFSVVVLLLFSSCPFFLLFFFSLFFFYLACDTYEAMCPLSIKVLVHVRDAVVSVYIHVRDVRTWYIYYIHRVHPPRFAHMYAMYRQQYDLHVRDGRLALCM